MPGWKSRGPEAWGTFTRAMKYLFIVYNLQLFRTSRKVPSIKDVHSRGGGGLANADDIVNFACKVHILRTQGGQKLDKFCGRHFGRPLSYKVIAKNTFQSTNLLREITFNNVYPLNMNLLQDCRGNGPCIDSSVVKIPCRKFYSSRYFFKF